MRLKAVPLPLDLERRLALRALAATFTQTYPWRTLMPLKLSVGLTKKIGLPSYSSLAASCHAEVELDNSLLQGDLEGFHRHVRNIFFSCRQAVNDELARQQQPE